MRRTALSASMAAGLALAIGSGLAPAAMASPAVSAGPAFSGREVFKIVHVIPGPLHPRATATGAFDASGYFVRRTATLVFPKGTIGIGRRVLQTSYSIPDLSTCRFKIWQKGTFRVVRATGRYRGLRERGRFWTTISGRLRQTGPDQCSSQYVTFRSVTYEVGIAR